jgi:hypothetical protein
MATPRRATATIAAMALGIARNRSPLAMPYATHSRNPGIRSRK